MASPTSRPWQHPPPPGAAAATTPGSYPSCSSGSPAGSDGRRMRMDPSLREPAAGRGGCRWRRRRRPRRQLPPEPCRCRPDRPVAGSWKRGRPWTLWKCPDNMKIKYSGSILIIGGESSGVELATEIAVHYPDKKVTLVHDRPRLLESIGHKAGGKALRWLRSRNVEVHLEQSVDLESMSEGDMLYRTSSGIEITADCYFSCLDTPLSSSWIRDSELKDCLDSDGRLTVDANLRVKGHSNIFAAGDISDAPELNQGYFVQRHAMLISKNIKLLMDGAKDSKLLKYKPSSTTPMVSLGKTDAVVQLSFAMVVGHLPAMWKSRDLFANKTRTLLGLPR